jgi:hypothetical protein
LHGRQHACVPGDLHPHGHDLHDLLYMHHVAFSECRVVQTGGWYLLNVQIPGRLLARHEKAGSVAT